MKYNLHTHTRFSDGSDEPVKYVEEAIRQGLSVLGFSDHSPVPFENNFAIREEKLPEYVAAISNLVITSKSKEHHPTSNIQYPTSLTILLGLEVDYIPAITQSFSSLRNAYPFDYLIGSVHLIRNDCDERLWFIDGPDIEVYDKGLKDIFGGDVRKAVTAYYRQLNRMIVKEKPDIIGHLDKIKMYNRERYFSENDPWYVDLVDETLRLVKESECVIEVNTRGMYKKRSESLFPGEDILRKINAMNLPVIISSDAHKPHEISLLFPETKTFLKEIGFKNQVLLTSNGWIDICL